jgi:two-component system, LytTR family, response regulator
VKIRALIVDDEPLARDGLLLRLAEHADLHVVGSIGNAAEAAAAIRRLAPDVVFLDVQMPSMTGFDVLAELEPGVMPLIVFVTAHDEFAVKAFRAHALDYLLKPIEPALLADSLDRVRQSLSIRDELPANKVRDLLIEVARGATWADRIPVRHDGRIAFIEVNDIERIEADGDYVRLHGGSRAHLVRERLTRLEARLDPKRFARIHRSTIVNLSRIAELQPWFHGEYVLITTSGTRLKVSRTYKDALAAAIGSPL